MQARAAPLLIMLLALLLPSLLLPVLLLMMMMTTCVDHQSSLPALRRCVCLPLCHTA